MQFLPLGISTKQVLKGVLHFCPYICLCVECGSELGLDTAIFSVYTQASGKQVHGSFRSWVRRRTAGWLHGAPESSLTQHDFRRNFSTEGRLDDWLLAKLVTAEQCKHLGPGWVQPATVSTAPGKAERRQAATTAAMLAPGQETVRRLSEATTWVILTADKYPGGE